MAKGSSYSAPQPDPQIGEAALLQARTGEEWLAFAKDAFAVSQERQKEIDALTREVTELQLGVARDQAGWSREDRQRYEDTFRPIEDKFIAEARDYASPERQEAAAAEAKADVQAAAGAQKEIARREAMSLGLSPASGRFQGMTRAQDLGTALASAGAANRARQQVRDKGLALQADVVNLGRGLPAQSAQAASLGLSGGSAASGAAFGANQQYINATGIMGQGYQGAMRGYAGQADTLNNLYRNQITGWAAAQDAAAKESAGMWSGIGSLAGMMMFAPAIFSDKKAKKEKQPIPQGKALHAVREMPVEEWSYKGSSERHVGTYAQDFKQATGRGNGRTIPVVDAIGITMKAVQDLDMKVDRLADVVIGITAKQPRPRAAAKPSRPSSENAVGLGA